MSFKIIVNIIVIRVFSKGSVSHRFIIGVVYNRTNRSNQDDAAILFLKRSMMSF